MAKFNVVDKRSTGTGPIVAEPVPTGVTHEGGDGYAHDDKSALFLLAVSNLVGEDTFYEKASDRDARFKALVRRVAVADPKWIQDFMRWLRNDGNMRSAPVVGALEAARALVDAGVQGGFAREIVKWSLSRGDEPGEALAYWLSTFGKTIPKPVKRGIADAAERIYGEYNTLKYDTGSHGVRFADVIELTHPRGTRSGKDALFTYALDRRHGRKPQDVSELPMVQAQARLRELAAGDPTTLLDTDLLRSAGMTWEDALSLVGSKVDKRDLWTSLIPVMGYMALLRNLRNFDEAGVTDKVAARVIERLTDPEQVKRSRQFPYRFLSAYEQAPSLRWSHALDTALQLSLANLPTLGGRSLVLIDTSASMSQQTMSAKSRMTPAKAAAVFGVALASKGEADLIGFASGTFNHPMAPSASVIREVDRFVRRIGEVGHGTEIARSVQNTLNRGVHKRVFIFSDMQTMDSGLTNVVPSDVALYGFNLGGYGRTAFDAGAKNRHEFGGLTDATFKMIPLLEMRQRAQWPWQV